MRNSWQPRWSFILLEALCIPAGIALGWLLGIDPIRTMDFSARSIAQGVAAAAPILILAALIVASPWNATQSLVELVDRLIVPFFRDWPIAEMALVAAAAGLGEELLFRGALQAAISQRYGIVPALLAASVAFGLVHFLNSAYAVFATVVGAYCGWLWLISGNLLVPIIAHGLYDFLALVYLTRWRRPPWRQNLDDRVMDLGNEELD